MSSGYETQDLRMKPLIQFTIGLIVLLAGSLFVSVFLAGKLTPESEEIVHPRAESREPLTAPRLQARPSLEIEQHRDAMENALREYRWVDPSAGVVQIPVDHATQMGVVHGFADLAENSKLLFCRSFFLFEKLIERQARHQIHGVVGLALTAETEVVDADDVGMA